VKPNDKIAIENVNTPGQITNVNRQKYKAMREAMLVTLPRKAPGLTHKEIMKAVLPHLPEAVFPGGKKTGWWSKAVQLDLEAKRIIVREESRPLRWHLA